MLDYCIRKGTCSGVNSEKAKSPTDSEEEFFEAVETQEEEEEEEEEEEDVTSSPVGIKHQLDNKILIMSGNPLNVPITQVHIDSIDNN